MKYSYDRRDEVDPKNPAANAKEVIKRLKKLRLFRDIDYHGAHRPEDAWWTAEPLWRQRLDHYGHGGEGWDEEAWREDYVEPLEKEVAAGLRKVDLDDALTFYVSEKGFVVFSPKSR